MKLHDLFEQIETLQFSLNYSILSGFKILLYWLGKDETIVQLIDEIRDSDEHIQQVYMRLLDVLSKYDQPDYVLFSDEALAAYLYALNQVDAELSHQAAEQIAQTRGLWWARRLAHHILQTAIPNP